MTIAEVILLVAGGIGLYVLFRPLQRWLERRLLQAVFRRSASGRPPIIDVTDFASHSLPRKDRHENHS
jgi:hypothetical protein